MRIVGGKLRGRHLASPKDHSIRPTTDRNRESLFNILHHRWPAHCSGRVLDIFAGTGALGLEALSRGASWCTFVERDFRAISLIRENIAAFDVTNTTNVVRMDATKPGKCDASGPFDLVFADPPYAKGLGEQALSALRAGGWFAADSLIVLEEKDGHLPPHVEGFDLHDQRKMGETAVGFYQLVTPG